jgi:trigger factor
MEVTLDKVKVKQSDEKPCKVTLSVAFAPEIVKSRREKVAAQFQKVAQLPGFRAGKAPMDLVRQNFSQKIDSEALDQIFRDYVPEILKEKKLRPVSTPMVEKLELNDGDKLSFNLVIEKNPEYKVKDYKKIVLTKKAKAITDADVEKELDELRERNAQLVPRPVFKGAEGRKPAHQFDLPPNDPRFCRGHHRDEEGRDQRY